MKSIAYNKAYTGPDITICAVWDKAYFPSQEELIGIVSQSNADTSYDYSRCISSSLIIDKDNNLIFYDLYPRERRQPIEFKIQQPEFYQWHKTRVYLRSDSEEGFHPNEITTEESQRKVIRRYFTENCTAIAKCHFGAIQHIKHVITDQPDGSFLLTIEYEARFEGKFSGFFE